MQRYYYSFSNYLKKRFGFKVHKIALDAGFTCPNRDGKVGIGGCIYCDNKSFSPNTKRNRLPVKEQILKGIEFYKNRNNAVHFIAYFQAFTNTYAPIDELKELYSCIKDFPEIVGLSIGTRPDCVSPEIIDLIQSFTNDYDVWIEYGIQSVHDKTLKLINRGHLNKDTEDAINLTKEAKDINICVHAIIGLPDETPKMMFETAKRIADWNVDGIKLHHLYVSGETKLEKMYKDNKFKVLSLNEYIQIACSFLELIPANVVVQRLVGEISGKKLIAPNWGCNKNEIINLIEKEFEKRGSKQGAACSTPCCSKF